MEARGGLVFDHHVIGRAGTDANMRHTQDEALLGSTVAGDHGQAGCMVGRRVARLDHDGRRARVAGHFANTSTTPWAFPLPRLFGPVLRFPEGLPSSVTLRDITDSAMILS